MVPCSILLIEDEPVSRELLAAYLGERLSQAINSPVEIDDAATAADARTKFRTSHYNAVLIDLNLPDGNGLDLAKDLREHTSTPIIFVTQSQNDEHKLSGLQLGAADFITKPYRPEELLLRLRNLLELSQHLAPSKKTKSDLFDCGSFIIDVGCATVQRSDGTSVPLTASELSILVALANARPRVLTRDTLLQAIHPDHHATPFDRNIDVHISNIRKKLGDTDRMNRIIITKTGIGYQMKA